MAEASQLSHKLLTNTALPYITFNSPIDQTPQFEGGRNVMISARQYCRMRPGFSDYLEPVPTTFNHVLRIFGWADWSSRYFVFAVDQLASGAMAVYKFQVGTDSSFQLIHTEPGKSGVPYSFTTANNYLFFSNPTDCWKWTTDHGKQHWGIAAPTVAPTVTVASSGPSSGTVTNSPTAGMNYPVGNPSSASPWTTGAAIGSSWQSNWGSTLFHSQSLHLYNCGFAVATGVIIDSVTVSISYTISPQWPQNNSTNLPQLWLGFIKNNVEYGPALYETSPATGLSGTRTFTQQNDGTSATWTPADVNASGFGAYFAWANGADASVPPYTDRTITVTAVTISVTWGPVQSAVNGGYQYVYTYENSVSGHESSPSPVSASTGNIADQVPTITWPLPTDPQVDTVNLYRTTDGGAADPTKMAWAGSWKVPTTSAIDTIPDTGLPATRFAPEFYENDPPQPMTSIISYAGRIWGIVGPRIWYSGQEEITNGVPQEAFPGASIDALDGNFYAYETLLTALAPLTDGVAVYNPNRIQKIEGDSLDTFRRVTLLAKRGTVTDYTVKVVGSSVLWFDRSNQLWLSDQGEIGRDIRPDLKNVSLTTVQAAIHIAGEQHWICLLDSGNSLLYVYDLDVNGWNVPWSVSGTCIESIDVSPGVTKLAIALNGTQIYLENPGLFLDGVNQYNAYAITNPISLAPESNPDMVAALHHVALESNAFQPVGVSVKTDEDSNALAAAQLHAPSSGFNPLNTVTDPPYRTNGQYLVQRNYMGSPDSASPACRRIALRLDWQQPEPALWALYSIDFAMIPLGR